MDIVIISQYLRNIENFENNNSRFVYLAKLLAKEKENDIEIITSDFNHTKKEKFNKVGELAEVKVTTCHELGYHRNVCLKRFNSHKKLSKNIKKYLEKRKKPDIIYCAIPSLSVGKIVARYAEKNNIRFIIDVQDLWPEAFKMIFNVPIISDIVFYPMTREANYIYSRADSIVAVSETYCNRVLSVNKKVDKGLSVFLGTNLEYFDACKEKNKAEFNDNIIRIAYIGTLGHSYDIISVMKAIKILNNKGINNTKFIVMGDGPLKNDFEIFAKENNIDCEFTGRLEYEKMIGLLCSCDIAVNPINGKSVSSIINKVGDYAAARLPVINTQNSMEYRELLEKYEIGFNCENNDVKDIAQKMEKLISNKELREKMGRNNRVLAEEKFDRRKTYKEIYELVVNNDRKNKKVNN